MMLSDDLKPDILTIDYPFPPMGKDDYFEMDVYARFMRHLRCVPTSRPEIRVLASIQFVADMMNLPDAQVAKILVDLGLRAPRVAFPSSYLEFADGALMREVYHIGSANAALRSLESHWRKIGEDCFAAFKRHYPQLLEGVFASV